MSAGRWPSYLLQRARRAPEPGLGIVPASTPVVCFGDPSTATVATLGINPTGREFLDHSGRLLRGRRRRLATLDSLDVPDPGRLTDEHAAAIVDDCVSYFERHPYHWFTKLDEIISAGLGASYFDRTACHLDLVQWATQVCWSGLSPAAQARLLQADVDFLRTQLDQAQFRVVVVNGRSALRWVEESGLVSWKREHTLPGTPTVGVYTGHSGPLRFVGWCCHVQSHAGAAAHAPRLAELVAELSEAAVVTPSVG